MRGMLSDEFGIWKFPLCRPARLAALWTVRYEAAAVFKAWNLSSASQINTFFISQPISPLL